MSLGLLFTCLSLIVLSARSQTLNEVELISNSVKGIFNGQQEYPYFIITPSSVTINEGEQVIVDCVAGGNPVPSVTWQRSIFGLVNTLLNNSLIVYQASLDDSGRYFCVADNGLGQIYSTFDIIVRVDGGLSAWSDWSKCNVECGDGNQFRERYCNNPPPRNGGKVCVGELTEARICSAPPCEQNVDGGFGEWSKWSVCSKSCNYGRQFRFRACNNPIPLGNGKRCNDRDAVEARLCNTFQCGVPQEVNEILGMVKGRVNDIDFFDGGLMSNLTLSPNGRLFIDCSLERIPDDLVQSLQLANVLLTPKYFGVIKHNGKNENGFELSEGRFQMEAEIKFESGELLKVLTKIEDIIGNTVPLLDIEMTGTIPKDFTTINVDIDDYKERVLQLEEKTIYGYSKQRLRHGNESIDYDVDYTITYNTSRRMDPPSRTYRVTDIITDGIKSMNKVNMLADVSMTEEENCPTGFRQNGIFCQDEDECMFMMCDHICTNTVGSFRCTCNQGYELMENGMNCKDIDECSLEIDDCHESKVCINTEGSFECIASICTKGYTQNNETGQCEDVDECLQPNACGEEQDCFNADGSHRCEYRPCGEGYFRNFTSGVCEDVDECIFANPCLKGQECINEPGNFRCEDLPCDEGFERSREDGKCYDIDECVQRIANCPPEHMCKNKIGSFTCEPLPCLLGFRRNEQKECEVDVRTGRCGSIAN